MDLLAVHGRILRLDVLTAADLRRIDGDPPIEAIEAIDRIGALRKVDRFRSEIDSLRCVLRRATDWTRDELRNFWADGLLARSLYRSGRKCCSLLVGLQYRNIVHEKLLPYEQIAGTCSHERRRRRVLAMVKFAEQQVRE